MFARVYFIIIIFFLAFTASSQEKRESVNPLKPGKYIAIISFTKESGFRKKVSGYPLSISDSGLLIASNISQRKNKKGLYNYSVQFVKAAEIRQLYFRRRGIVGWSVLGGSVVGFITGGAIASANIKKTPSTPSSTLNLDGLKAMPGIMIGGTAGGLTGGLIAGRIRKRFTINGNPEYLRLYQGSMLRFLPNQATH